jgi:predicted lipoprotein with Yx(FWY)xxD motif
VESPTVESTAVTTPVVSGTATGGPTIQKGTAGLVDAGGFSLYIFASDVEGSGQSACVAGCSSAWPPLVVDGLPTAGPGVTGDLGLITRLDGSLQVTYNGKPLYRWINDVNPGDTTGTAIKNWSLAQP